jgi:hypothetical protein
MMGLFQVGYSTCKGPEALGSQHVGGTEKRQEGLGHRVGKKRFGVGA